MASALYLVPVPLAEGAVDTLPERTLKVVRGLRVYFAENARSARAALKALGHPLPIADLEIVDIGHHPTPQQAEAWIARLDPGVDAAVLSEAGCPGVADPGAVLVAAAARAGRTVVPLVGPSALLLALMASGGNGQRFRFVGYLPHDPASSTREIRELARRALAGETQIAIETPYRNARLLEAILAHADPRVILSVAVDLTGPGEQVASGTVDAWRRGATVRPDLARRPAVFTLAGTTPSAAGATAEPR